MKNAALKRTADEVCRNSPGHWRSPDNQTSAAPNPRVSLFSAVRPSFPHGRDPANLGTAGGAGPEGDLFLRHAGPGSPNPAHPAHASQQRPSRTPRNYWPLSARRAMQDPATSSRPGMMDGCLRNGAATLASHASGCDGPREETAPALRKKGLRVRSVCRSGTGRNEVYSTRCPPAVREHPSSSSSSSSTSDRPATEEGQLRSPGSATAIVCSSHLTTVHARTHHPSRHPSGKAPATHRPAS